MDRMTNFSFDKRILLSLVVISVLALIARIYQIDTLSIWLDEAYSEWFASQGWERLWREVPEYETHPVLYYSILKAWKILGNDAVTLRLLSMLLNLLALPFILGTVWMCGDERNRKPAVILVAILFAFSNTQLGQSQNARQYALMTLAMAATLFFLVFTTQNAVRVSRSLSEILRSDRPVFFCLIGFSFSLPLLMWSHNIGVIFATLIGSILLAWSVVTRQQGRFFINLLLVATISIVLYLPHLKWVIRQATTMGETGFWLTPPRLKLFAKDIMVLTLGLAPFCLLSAWCLFRSSAVFIAVILVTLTFAPMAITAVVSYLWEPIYIFRSFAASQVPALVLLALAPSAVRHYFGLKWYHATAALIVVAALSSAAYYHYRVAAPNLGRQENYRTLVARAIDFSGGRQN